MQPLDDRLMASLPRADPRFTEVRAYLTSITGRGRQSMRARAAGELMLVGFAVLMGRLAPGSGRSMPDLPGMPSPGASAPPLAPFAPRAEVEAIAAHVAALGIDFS